MLGANIRVGAIQGQGVTQAQGEDPISNPRLKTPTPMAPSQFTSRGMEEQRSSRHGRMQDL